MNYKKVAVYSVLTFLALFVTLSFVSAATTSTWQDVFGSGFWNFLTYIFGPPVNVVANATSAAIITIAVWLLVMITFGDIISTFSTFKAWVSWVAAFLIGAIAANLGVMTNLIVWFTGIFAFAGAMAVYVGLGGAFVAFIVVNLGLVSWKKWIINRKAMMAAATSEAGGKRLAGAIKGLGSAGKALEKVGA